MELEAVDKSKVEVVIMDKKYTLVANETDCGREFLEEVVSMVNSQLKSIRIKNPVLSREDTAVLTSVNLMADKLRLSDLVYHDGEYEKLKEENELLQKKVIELEDKLRNSKNFAEDLQAQRDEMQENERKLAETIDKQHELEERLLASETKLLFAQKELKNREHK